jgi:hypothetical protein
MRLLYDYGHMIVGGGVHWQWPAVVLCLLAGEHFDIAVSGRGTTVQYGTVQYSTVQYSTVQYSTVQYSTVTVQYG